MRALWFVAGLALVGLGCNRPTDEDCRRAVQNLTKLRNLETNAQAPDPEAAVRKCRSTGNRETVACVIRARTIAEAEACNDVKR